MGRHQGPERHQPREEPSSGCGQPAVGCPAQSGCPGLADVYPPGSTGSHGLVCVWSQTAVVVVFTSNVQGLAVTLTAKSHPSGARPCGARPLTGRRFRRWRLSRPPPASCHPVTPSPRGRGLRARCGRALGSPEEGSLNRSDSQGRGTGRNLATGSTPAGEWPEGNPAALPRRPEDRVTRPGPRRGAAGCRSRHPHLVAHLVAGLARRHRPQRRRRVAARAAVRTERGGPRRGTTSLGPSSGPPTRAQTAAVRAPLGTDTACPVPPHARPEGASVTVVAVPVPVPAGTADPEVRRPRPGA